MLNKIIKFSSLSGALLIFFGFLKLVIYYSYFNLEIVNFIAFSEIITSFLDDINILVFFGCIMALQSGPIMNYFHKKSKLKIEELFDIIMEVIYKFKLWYILFYIVILTFLMLLLLFETTSLNYFVVYFMTICILQILTYFLVKKVDDGKYEISTFNVGISIFIGLIVGVFLLAHHDIENIESQKRIVKIETSDSTFECNSNNSWVYLGKTDQFLFLHNLNAKSNVIIPSSELKIIEFKN